MERRLLPISLALTLLVTAVLTIACSEDNHRPSGPAQGNPRPGLVLTPTTLGVAPPSDVKLTGPLPNLLTPVPPGQGEQGRLTVDWKDNSNSETGFRIVQQCEDGLVTPIALVAANETRYGPIQACRPGRVGVVALSQTEASAIVWAP